MRRAIIACVHVKTENVFRALAFIRNAKGVIIGPHIQAKETSDMHATIAALLTQLERPRQVLSDGSPNEYRVTLTRVSPGYTDDDGLSGGTMKAVRDAVAKWIGIDDGHARIAWSYRQQACPKKDFALRIEVEDLEPGVDVIIERGNVPARIAQARQRGSEEPRPSKHAPIAQTKLVFRESFAVLPWDQDGGDPVLSPLSVEGDPPPRIQLRVPATVFASCGSVRFAPGSTATFERSLGRVEGKEAWIFSLPDRVADTRGISQQSRRTRP